MAGRRLSHRFAHPAIDLRVAALAWLLTWFLGQLLGALILEVAPDSETRPIGLLALALVASWTAYLAGLWWASRQGGTGDLRADYRWSWSWADLIAVPVGVITQILILPLVYLPLRWLWPEVFDAVRLEENARRLVDSAQGLWLVMLVVLVVVGAPVVEELVYRGLLQQSWASTVSTPLALLIGSAWFAVIHFRPVEYPGLFVAGLVFGGCLIFTGRLGTAITAHAAFNLAGLAMVWAV
jgi:membrane protease YdiL (CAAX protease family)